MNELRRRALRLLARREHTRAELAGKLGPLGSREEIEILIVELQQNGLLSDARVADAYLRSHGARFGVARLRRDMRAKGIATELVEQALATDELAGELERARTLWSKKFGTPPVDRREWAKQARFLQARGFSSEVIRCLMREPEA